MKLITILLMMLLSVNCNAQFTHKTSYTHNFIDGWIRHVEASWYTIDQRGDTTFYTEVSEDTQQDDPNEKPKYEFNGAGQIVKHDTIKIIPNLLVTRSISVSISEDSATVYGSNDWKIPAVKYIKGANGKTKYKYRDRYKYRYRKNPVAKVIKPPKPKPVETINILEYKKRLWIIVTHEGVVAIDSNTKKYAITKFKKISSQPIIAISEFSQGSIIQ